MKFNGVSAFISLAMIAFETSERAQAFSNPWHPSTGSLVVQCSSMKTTATSGDLSTTPSDSKGSTAKGVTLNPLVTSVKISKTVEVFSIVKEMQANGEIVTSLCVGEPDFPPPQAVLDATVEAVRSQPLQTSYTAVTGTAALRGAIAADLEKRKNVKYNPATEIVVANGAKQAVYQGVLATVGLGDLAIIPAPFWPSYPEMVTLAGGTPIILNTKQDDGYLINPASLRSMLEQEGDAVKLLFLCNPSNPTGGVHDQAALEAIAAVLKDFPQVVVLADEIYERLVYASDDGDDPSTQHVSFASIDGMFERTITINGMSKAYAMTGYRLGYMAAPAYIAKACTTIQSQLTSCASSISQAAGVAALLKVPESEMIKNVKIMKEKRDYVIQELRSMDNVSLMVPPTGAFYVLPDVSHYYDGDDTQLCIDLLKSKKLALVPGSSFGAPGTVRISYATSMQELELAMSKLRDFLSEQN
jgi:aspartate/methionine/tyrosine aminotransferase